MNRYKYIDNSFKENRDAEIKAYLKSIYDIIYASDCDAHFRLGWTSEVMKLIEDYWEKYNPEINKKDLMDRHKIMNEALSSMGGKKAILEHFEKILNE